MIAAGHLLRKMAEQANAVPAPRPVTVAAPQIETLDAGQAEEALLS
jgi:hypothetical protein